MIPRHASLPLFRHVGSVLTASLLLASCAGPAAQGPVDAAPAASAASVTIGAATAEPLGDPSDASTPERLSGSIDTTLVTQEVERRLGALQQCYEARLATHPGLSGEVLIHWGIAETGVVNEACITNDTIGDQVITACVNQLVASGPYPASTSYPLDIEIPFVFSAG
jgi:hypothetical protein